MLVHAHAVFKLVIMIIPLQKPMCEGQVLNAEGFFFLMFGLYVKKHHSLF